MVDLLQLQTTTDDLLLEDGSGRLALEYLRQSFEAISTANDAVLTVATVTDIPVGQVILLGTSKTSVTGSPLGVTSITDPSGNAWHLDDADAGRASTYDLAIHRCIVTTLIPAGSTITITFNHTSTRKAVVGSVWAGLLGTLDQTSGDFSGSDGGTSIGDNGSSALASTSTLGATTAANELVLSVISNGGTTVVTPGTGMTAIDDIKTTVGSSDRGLMLQYKIVSATGVQTATGNYSTSGGWAAAVATYPIDMGVAAPAVNKGAFFALL